ncbi:hypothetical protein Acr_18g0010020 [Actinidia rufa]|uniref:Uncharacterized protein n=1 Tax=Actinidia rufa TaxID=165716 RepID=A0A7J0G7X7_9ERIC|nr:hypothetical protein Acr_18g0010020 [Actinidia rufa]
MAINNQVPDLEGLHREMHGIAEQTRIMNENNARLIQHLTINNPTLLAIAPVSEEKEALPGQSLDCLAKLTILRARRPSEEEGHLAEMIRHLDGEVVLEVEGANDKVVIMAMMEELRPCPLFDSLSKNVPETQSALQNKADKYIIAKKLVEAKRRRRERDDHKRKEPDTRRADYKDEVKSRRSNRDARRRTNDRRPRMPPCLLDLILSPLNTPISQLDSPDRRYGDNRPMTGDIQETSVFIGFQAANEKSKIYSTIKAIVTTPLNQPNYSPLMAAVNRTERSR